MPGLDRAAVRAHAALLRTATPVEYTARLRETCADDIHALLSALDAADLNCARQAETALRCARLLGEALALIDGADTDPGAAAHLHNDLRRLLQDGREPGQDHILDACPRHVADALAVLAGVDVDLLSGPHGDLLRQVRAALTGAGDRQAVPA